MKKIILTLIFAITASVFAFGNNCFGTYARKVGEYKDSYNTKICVYEAMGKKYSLPWDAYGQCPYSIEIDTYSGRICKIN